MSRPLPTRAEVVRLARLWIGTPYHHQASRLGVGADCIGLVRGVHAALYGRDVEPAGAYTRDWAEATGEETLLHAARRHLIEIAPGAIGPGDVAVFRYRAVTLAKHTGILACAPGSGALTLVHASEGAPVAEVPLSPWWRRRIAGAFAFPGLID